jgi:hypothetical protein
MENAQFRLGRGHPPVVTTLVRGAALAVMILRGEIIAKVPGRMDERATLRAEQQDSAGSVKESPLHRQSGSGRWNCY